MVAHREIKKISKFFLIACFFSIIFQSISLTADDFPNFSTYCEKFNKIYDNGQYEQRQIIYNQNIQLIINSNCSAKGVNMFTDSTPEEMQQLKGGFEANVPRQPLTSQQIANSNNSSDSIPVVAGITLTDKTPLTYDWRDYKAVTPIKYQKSCGSCWAFSTTAFFQSDLIINSNYTNQINLSQQFLLKCDNRSLKCDGGFLFWAMNRIIDETTGMPTENQYPYNYSKIIFQDGMCYETDLIKVDPKKKMVSYFNVEDITFIEKMILKKPVNVNLCSKDMQFYAPTQASRTLVCDANVTKRDHTVLLIGYTQTQWIIKNQWSTSWGVEGYGYISKNVSNDCCIGKQLYTTGVVSQKCSVQNCSICIQETSCYQCKDGYYVYSSGTQHLCRKCNQQYCAKCLNFFGVCDVCQEGYSVVYPYYTCQQSTIEHCSFMYVDSCAECHQGYVLNIKGQCISQKNICYVQNCQQCRQYMPTVCITCDNGYYLNNVSFLCEKLPQCKVDNCSRCEINNPLKCEICLQQNYEFSLTQLKCVLKCPIDGCQSCGINVSTNDNSANNNSTITTTICTKCQVGYRLSQNNQKCQQCQVQYCSDCSTDITLCTTCMVGFYFNSITKQCQSCSDDIHNKCIQCQINSLNTLLCTRCNNGYTINHDGTQCIRCLSDCVTCSYKSLNVCSNQCGAMNYFNPGNNLCQSCPSNCLSCTSSSICNKCVDGFLLQDGICYYPCIQGDKCSQCQLSSNSNTSICRQCSAGYIMQNNTCIFNSSFQCLQENGLNPLNCNICPQKYYLNTNYNINICTKCRIVDVNCVSCSANAPGYCTGCDGQYYLDKVNNKCVRCDMFDGNCEQCSANNFCTQCKSGYYILSTASSSQTTISNNLNENSGKCLACSAQCLTCKYYSQFCLTCKQGYQLTINKKCLNKIKIRFNIVLDADYDNVLNEFVMTIYDNLAIIFNLQTSKELDIFYIQKGSIKVTGDFHMPQGQTDSNAFLQKTRSILGSQSKIGQYQILSSQANLVTDPVIMQDDGKKMQMIVLIAVAVGGGVFAIVVVIILIWAIRKYGCKKEDGQNGNKQQAKANGKDNNNKIVVHEPKNPHRQLSVQSQQKKSNKSTNSTEQKRTAGNNNFNNIILNNNNKARLPHNSNNDTCKYLNQGYQYECPEYFKNDVDSI